MMGMSLHSYGDYLPLLTEEQRLGGHQLQHILLAVGARDRGDDSAGVWHRFLRRLMIIDGIDFVNA